MGEASELALIRRDKLKKDFIKEFSQSLNMTATCEKLEVDQATINNLLRLDSDFKLAKQLCEEAILDKIESRVFKDAAKEDNKLAMFLLRTRRAEKYGINHQGVGNVQVNVQVNLSEVES